MKRFVCLNACGLGELVTNLDLGLAAFGNEAAVHFERQRASSRVTLHLPWLDWTRVASRLEGASGLLLVCMCVCVCARARVRMHAPWNGLIIL